MIQSSDIDPFKSAVENPSFLRQKRSLIHIYNSLLKTLLLQVNRQISRIADKRAFSREKIQSWAGEGSAEFSQSIN